MKRVCRMLSIVSIALGLRGFARADENDPREAKIQAIQRIRDTRDNLAQKRTMAYYVAEERVLKEKAEATAVVKVGGVIMAGRFIAPPYEIRKGTDFITINEVAVEPRFKISGELNGKSLPDKNQTEAEVATAELIAQKRIALYEETGNYILVIPRLVSYAKSLGSVQDVRVKEGLVTVTFGSNGATSEVGYICREMRKPSSTSVTNSFDQEYRDICSWLRDGKCVFVPLKGMPRLESPTLAKKLNVLLKTNVAPDSTPKQSEHEIALVSECFTTPITAEDAAVVTANWHRGDSVP